MGVKIKASTKVGQELYELNCLLAAMINPQCHFIVDASGGDLRIEDVKLMIENLINGNEAGSN